MFREPVLENCHERCLFFDGEPIGGIQNWRILCDGQNLMLPRILGNDVFLPR